MQKRSLPIHFHPIRFDPLLAIHGGKPYEQKDRPITYLHVHDCLEIGYCYSGSGIYMIGGKVLSYKAGDVSCINHTEVHLARSAPGTTSQWTWIYLDPIRLVGRSHVDVAWLDSTPLAGLGFSNLFSTSKHPEVIRIVLRLIEELNGNQPGREVVLRALAWEFMILVRREAPLLDPVHSPGHEFDRIAPALQFLNEHYNKPVDIERLARSCRLSPPHFRRLFTRTIGCSPRSYWHAVRLNMAASLLQTTSRSILEVSLLVGFETLSSFNRLFRKFFDTSPRTWRTHRQSVSRITNLNSKVD